MARDFDVRNARPVGDAFKQDLYIDGEPVLVELLYDDIHMYCLEHMGDDDNLMFEGEIHSTGKALRAKHNEYLDKLASRNESNEH